MTYSWLSTAQLEAHVAYLLARAHDANGQNYAARARDWEVARDELERRRREKEA